jgi:hypothetical protein
LGNWYVFFNHHLIILLLTKNLGYDNYHDDTTAADTGQQQPATANEGHITNTGSSGRQMTAVDAGRRCMTRDGVVGDDDEA